MKFFFNYVYFIYVSFVVTISKFDNKNCAKPSQLRTVERKIQVSKKLQVT